MGSRRLLLGLLQDRSIKSKEVIRMYKVPVGKMRLTPLPPLHICPEQQHSQKVRHVDES